MKHPSITKVKALLHGADYNPEQWLDSPEILEADVKLMKEAGCNVMSLGIFSWAALEPEEGQYHFEWLDQVIDRLYAQGIYTILATPSGARPAWLAQKYPEVLRTNSLGQKQRFGARHNHCPSSPLYREKVAQINKALALRYGKHPAIVMWHISNEYGGECFCEGCQNAFRSYVKERYQNLDTLNHQYWAYFWSHTYTDWSQVEAPSPLGETGVHGLTLDWRRFVSKLTIDFYLNEVKDIRAITPDIPITTNFMDFFDGLDYHDFSKELDVIAIDLYPAYRNKESDYKVAIQAAFTLDLMRSLKQKPFVLMESTVSTQNWQDIATIKRPGQHIQNSLSAIAHGSDTVQYFQWRKSRGASEKFHSAVVDHVGHSDTRVFKEVAELGKKLASLGEVVGTHTVSKAAILFDWDNWWAINDYQGYSNIKRDYKGLCFEHYKALFELGINVDIISPEAELSQYELVIAPQLYMTKASWASNIERFVSRGGKFVLSCLSGIVNENDLVYLGGAPGPLQPVMGLWVEETDVLYEDQLNSFAYNHQQYPCHSFFDRVRLTTARALSNYESDFYAGEPVITVNDFGKGEAYYLGSLMTSDFLKVFYQERLADYLSQQPVEAIDTGVDLTIRGSEEERYLFIMNTTDKIKQVTIRENYHFENLLDPSEIVMSGPLKLAPFEVKVFKSRG